MKEGEEMDLLPGRFYVIVPGMFPQPSCNHLELYLMWVLPALGCRFELSHTIKAI